MRTIGLIGGMSWESTVPYYRIINESVRDRLGGLHSAKIVLYSVDFHEVELLQRTEDWEAAGRLMAQAAISLEAVGADLLALCTNTMHRVASVIEEAVTIPLLHIADPTADAIKAAGFRRIGLLATRFTMEQNFFRDRLQRVHGIDALIPGRDDRETVHRMIYDELCLGIVSDASREAFQQIIVRLVDHGAEAVVLGCTEIAMLVGAADSPVPIFDTTSIHARRAAEWATSGP